MPNGVEFEGRYIHVGTFPIGIDPEKFTDALKEDKIQNRIQQLKSRFGDCKVIVGVDRLDYIKGVPQKVILASSPEFFFVAHMSTLDARYGGISKSTSRMGG